VAAPPSGFWADHFDIERVATPEEGIRALALDGARYTFLGDPDITPAGIPPESVNPSGVIHALDYHRLFKSEYEVECLRRANRLAVAGHLAARDAFKAGASELDAHLAYLSASRQLERQLPYPNIVAFNEHAATLHYDRLEKDRPRETRSLLIDAGATFLGYAADVTRTWSAANGRFAALIDRVDDAQQTIADRVAVGVSYLDLHLEMHEILGGVLADADLVNMSPAAMVEQGVTATFFPHGLGHQLGLQVHDVGGKLADALGNNLGQPAAHPSLRNLRPVEVGNVFTIEPGLYFIPQLLDKLRSSPAGKDVNWRNVDELLSCGGVRIEDDVFVTKRGLENLTREAFLALED
jgi:Xaa-Pro dipeptidase